MKILNFDVMMLLLGVYLFVSAILGKGMLFENAHINCSRQKYNKYVRIAGLAAGMITILNNGLIVCHVIDESTRWYVALWGIEIFLLLILGIINFKYTERK